LFKIQKRRVNLGKILAAASASLASLLATFSVVAGWKW
jgi:hypothetical protein